MKQYVVFALLGLFVVVAAQTIALNIAIPCQETEDCADYSSELSNATCQGGFCICKNTTDTFNCSSSAVAHPEKKYSDTIHRPCKQDQGCNFAGGECNKTISQCVCKPDHVLSTNKHKCLEKAREIGYPCTDEKQCLGFLANTTCRRNECVCVDDHHFAENRCNKKIAFGETCTINGECSHVTGAVCTEKKICGCPAETAINMDGKRCLPVAREILDECVENVQCSMTFTNSLCIDKKCQCEEDYHYESEMSRCFLSKGLGENCGYSYECYQAPDEGENVTGKVLQCLSNTCTCTDDYYRENDKCVNAASNIIGLNILFFVLALFLHKLGQQL